MRMIERIQQYTPELLAQYEDVETPDPKVVVLGTFKAWPRIKQYRTRLTNAGLHVLAPHGNEITHYANTFEVLDEDAASLELMEKRWGKKLSETEVGDFLELVFLHAIDNSDFVYVVGQPRPEITDGEYIGVRVAEEIAWAGRTKRVYSSGLISPTLDARDGLDTNFQYYAHMIIPAEPEHLAMALAGPKVPNAFPVY